LARVRSDDRRRARDVDEALFETAHLIASLAAADGAVVMSKQNELLGFGGMVSGRLPDVERVGRALDLEGEKVAEEETGNVGARHRSAYRLADALPGSVAVVISQDGGVRFVCRKGGRVTYWEQE
jgi:DNA integrity scanning protein DisA with diadenylate cyclase activity